MYDDIYADAPYVDLVWRAVENELPHDLLKIDQVHFFVGVTALHVIAELVPFVPVSDRAQ